METTATAPATTETKPVRAKRTSETVYNEVLAIEERKDLLKAHLQAITDGGPHSPIFGSAESELKYGDQTMIQLGKRSESLTVEYNQLKEKESTKAAKDTMTEEQKAAAKLAKKIEAASKRLEALKAAANGAAPAPAPKA